MEKITIINNPTIIDMVGDHNESASYQVEASQGSTFSGGEITVDICGDFDLTNEYITLKIDGQSLGNLSSGKQDWKYHQVMANESIEKYIKGKTKFVIEVVPSPEVHRLWANAWGVVINFNAQFSKEKIKVSNWRLDEKHFEPNDEAKYKFDIQNVSGLELSSIKVHLVKDENVWKPSSGLQVVSPAGMTWEIPKLLPNEKKELVLELKTINGKPGDYPLPQVMITSSIKSGYTYFQDSNLKVVISED